MLGREKRKRFDYNDPDIFIKLIDEHKGGMIAACVTGRCGIGQVDMLRDFCTHVVAAARCGDPASVALACFMRHEGENALLLPTRFSLMSEPALATFVYFLRIYMAEGYSEAVKQYLRSSQDEVRSLAEAEDPHAQWLMGAWYAFDEFEIKGEDWCMHKRMYWYEKSAMNGFDEAMLAVGGLFDNGDDTAHLSLPKSWKKAAFWYREGALEGNAFCAYNLALMYYMGNGVEKSYPLATLWLSLALSNCNDDHLRHQIYGFSRHMDVSLSSQPDLSQDRELDPFESEYQDAY
jgi:hypothetical protein